MLARVTAAKDGVVEYLVHGMKSHQEVSRDELDERICIDGNLATTDEIIKQQNKVGREENYLHITLSFGEREITQEQITEAYQNYKNTLMSAYDPDEYNIYAEIHYPKIKSYQDKKTKETVERLPHVHIVIPKQNLLSDKSLNPFGRYSSNIDYHDAIQESVNRKLKLQSPYDNQRQYRINDEAEFISRYKGDTFKGSRGEFKQALFERIDADDIRTTDDFETLLAQYGDVSKGKAGSTDEYFKVKPAGHTKNIRLTETCFKSAYIENRELLRPKPSDRKINKLVNEWVNVRSHEMKHIHPASPKLRQEYYELKPEQQQEFLHERRKHYDEQYTISAARRRTADHQPGLDRSRLKQFADIPNGLPSVSPRALVRATGEDGNIDKSLLSRNEHDHMESARAGRNNQLRRVINGHGRYGQRIEYAVTGSLALAQAQPQHVVNNPNALISVAEQLLNDHIANQQYQQELTQFRVIRKTLEADRLLDHFEKTQAIVKEHYTTFKAKDGSARIKIGTRAFNVSDFCTQHMRMNWSDAKQLLTSTYQTQLSDKEETNAIHAISFVGQYVTQGHMSKRKLDRLDESIMILKHLQRKETYSGENTMPLADLAKYKDAVQDTLAEKNTISNADQNTLSASEEFKRQQAVQIIKMNDLVAVKDLKKKQVNFVNQHNGETVFKDTGTAIIMTSRNPPDDHIAAAMTVSAEKFGVVKITGTKAFKQKVVDIAVEKDLKIVFKSPKMQELFTQLKQQKTEQLQASQKPASDPISDSEKKLSKDAQLSNKVGKEDDEVNKAVFKVDYKWSEADKKMEVTINGKKPDQVPSQTLEKIIANDRFLKNYSLNQVQSGKLELNQAKEVAPVASQFNQQGDKVVAQTLKSTPKLRQ